MIHGWEKQYPGRIDNMLTAMGNVVPSHLMDRKLYPFETIQASGVADRTATRPSTTNPAPTPPRRWRPSGCGRPLSRRRMQHESTRTS
jgi:tRNA 2-thiocytidine biosynthesis protein TtcA